MYRVFRQSVYNYKKIMKGDEYRSQLIDPIELLVDREAYIKEKQNNSERYKELRQILLLMKNKIAQYDKKYHKFYNFLFELECLEYEIEETDELMDMNKGEEYLSLINQLLSFQYMD